MVKLTLFFWVDYFSVLHRTLFCDAFQYFKILYQSVKFPFHVEIGPKVVQILFCFSKSTFQVSIDFET
jgi:hypothetical protein